MSAKTEFILTISNEYKIKQASDQNKEKLI